MAPNLWLRFRWFVVAQANEQRSAPSLGHTLRSIMCRYPLTVYSVCWVHRGVPLTDEHAALALPLALLQATYNLVLDQVLEFARNHTLGQYQRSCLMRSFIGQSTARLDSPLGR